MADVQRMASGSETSSVSVTGLSKAYGPGGPRALDDFTLEFPAGQCTVLLGPSGLSTVSGQSPSHTISPFVLNNLQCTVIFAFEPLLQVQGFPRPGLHGFKDGKAS